MEKDYFANRRTVRRFSDRKVSDEMLRAISERAMKAPTTGGMQLYSVVVTRKEPLRTDLAEAHFSQPAAVGAPVIVTVCADLHRFERWCRISGTEPGFENFLSFTSAMLDATIFAQQFCTIAEMEGLGTCYLGTTLWQAPKISELLHLPDHVVPVCGIAVGWPYGEGEATERLPLEALYHTETYTDFSDEEVKELYKVKDEYPANRGYVEEHSKPSLAHVFTEVRYPRQMNEEFTASIKSYLERQGLL